MNVNKTLMDNFGGFVAGLENGNGQTWLKAMDDGSGNITVHQIDYEFKIHINGKHETKILTRYSVVGVVYTIADLLNYPAINIVCSEILVNNN